MRKLWVFVLWIIVISWFTNCFWYYEDKVYCNIEGENITIFLKKNAWMLTCKTYMDTVYQLALKKYNEIMTINYYIEQWEDVYYRKNILEKEKMDFLQLVNYRTQIKMVVDEFESVLFEKYYRILQKPMKVYYSDLETMYYILVNQKSSSNMALRIAQIEQQMWNVSRILEAKNLGDIMNVVSSYIYLKKQLEWI